MAAMCARVKALTAHPGGNPGANLESISHRCYIFEEAFVWELTKENIVLPLGCLQGGMDPLAAMCARVEVFTPAFAEQYYSVDY